MAVQRAQGDHALRHVSERIGALALAGDMAGVTRWREITTQLDRLSGSAMTRAGEKLRGD